LKYAEKNHKKRNMHAHTDAQREKKQAYTM